MFAEQLLREQAIQFLKDKAVLAYIAIFFGVLGIGFLLQNEKIESAVLWTSTVLFIQTLSLLLRYSNKTIFVTKDRRETFGITMNLIDSFLIGSSILYVPYVDSGVAAIINVILIVLCTGSSITSAGYKPLFWSFCAPLFIIQIAAYSIYYSIYGVNTYVIFIAMSLLSALLVSFSAQNSRHTFLAFFKSQFEAERAHQSKSRFFMASSHDLRQPVVAAAAFIASAEKHSDSKDVLSNLSRAKEAIDAIDAHISPMMELARIDSGSFNINIEKIDLNTMLESLVSRFEPCVNNNTQLIITLPNNPLFCHTDGALIERIISNIIDNSVKYTTDGEIRVDLVAEQNEFVLTVRDTGIGIEPNQLDLIFDEFYQVDNRDHDPSNGFGLGLSIAKRLCSKLNIGFTLNSELNEFTQAELVIPKKVDPITATAPSISSPIQTNHYLTAVSLYQTIKAILNSAKRFCKPNSY